MSEDRVVKLLKELSGKLWRLSRELDELSRDIENFIEAYRDAYGEDEEWDEEWVDYDYNYLCQDCKHEFEFEEFTKYRACPRCGSTDIIHIAKGESEHDSKGHPI